MPPGRLTNYTLIGIFISVFINSIVLTQSPVDFYIGYLVFIVLLPGFILRHGFPQWTLVFIVLLLSGMFYTLSGDNTADMFFKIFVGLFASYLFYYYVIVEADYQTESLFRYYLKAAWIVSVIGFVQFLSFKIGFLRGYEYGWLLNKWGVVYGGSFGIRINSVFGEPTYYGAFMSAPFFIAAYDLISLKPFYFTKIKSVIVMVVYFLSDSGLGYLGIMFTLILLFINFGLIRYFIIAIPLGIVLFNFIYENSFEFRTRYDSTVDVFTTGHFTVGADHGSTIILYNNYHIALENFKVNPLFGTGLGSHPIAAEKYSLTKDIVAFGFELNYADASSMFNRIMSETGLFGLILFFFILFKFYVRRNPDINSNHWLITNSFLVLILVNLLRQGHYFLNGFPFYVWMYIYNYYDYQKVLEAAEESVLTTSPLPETPVQNPKD